MAKKEKKEQMILNATLDPKKKYTLTRSQRSALKPKGKSVSDIKSEYTGAELMKLLKGIKTNPASFGIEK